MIGAVWLFRNLLDEKSHRANNFIALAFDKGRLTILKSMACSKLEINYNDDSSIECLHIARNMMVRTSCSAKLVSYMNGDAVSTLLGMIIIIIVIRKQRFSDYS